VTSGRGRRRACEALGVWFWLIAILMLSQGPCEAQTLPRVREVGQGIYAIIGDLDPQRFDNDGLNANFGFVVGADAVLVITGPSRRTGAAVVEEVRRITWKPVRWVINLNSQNHYWWGNSALLDAKPTFIAHPEAVRLMKEQQEDQRALLLKLLRERFQGSEPWLPNRLVADRLTLEVDQYYSGANTQISDGANLKLCDQPASLVTVVFQMALPSGVRYTAADVRCSTAPG
jgi:hypothetical protein